MSHLLPQDSRERFRARMEWEHILILLNLDDVYLLDALRTRHFTYASMVSGYVPS